MNRYPELDELQKYAYGVVSFIQIGANDGLRGDPLHDYIMEYDWQGILVELRQELKKSSNPLATLQKNRQEYAELISRAKIFIFGSSIYNYPVRKYLEGMASGCLVMAPLPKDAAILNFVDGVNMIDLTGKIITTQVADYLCDTVTRTHVALWGLSHAKISNSVETRVDEFIEKIKVDLTTGS